MIWFLFHHFKETDQPGEILLMDFGLADDGEKSTTLLNSLDDSPIEKDITVFSSIHTPNERNEMLEVDVLSGERLLEKNSKRVSKLDQQKHESNSKFNRKKRQADLSSHTQDGVPIFDRGYGATPNRTEGLRIYQSLLANSGRNEPQSSNAANLQTDTVVQQPHHRQNNFWRNRKEKPRHRHQKPTTRSPLTDDIELSSIPEFDAANGQDLRSVDTSTGSPPAKSSVAPNVEFRHSRVKTSSETRDNGPLSVDQKIWSTSRNNGIFSIGAGPYAGASQEDRISAATAPAILTKTVTASVGSSSQLRQQPNIYKVNQPAMNSRSASTQSNSENEDFVSRDSPPSSSSSSSSAKKRINKKQLRDLSHTATAVHLVADTRNSTSASFENQGNYIKRVSTSSLELISNNIHRLNEVSKSSKKTDFSDILVIIINNNALLPNCYFSKLLGGGFMHLVKYGMNYQEGVVSNIVRDSPSSADFLL